MRLDISCMEVARKFTVFSQQILFGLQGEKTRFISNKNLNLPSITLTIGPTVFQTCVPKYIKRTLFPGRDLNQSILLCMQASYILDQLAKRENKVNYLGNSNRRYFTFGVNPRWRTMQLFSIIFFKNFYFTSYF